MEDTPDAVEHESIGAEFRDDLSSIYKKVRIIAEDAIGCIVVRLDEDVCLQFDRLVEAGAVENRSQAALFFLKQGMAARRDLFDKISRTELEVERLRQQLRKLKTVESAE